MRIIESSLLSEEVRTVGSGDSDGEEFQSRAAEVIVSGSVNSKIHVADAVVAHVSGSGDWGSVFCDPIIATAVLDRLLNNSTTAGVRDESYRS